VDWGSVLAGVDGDAICYAAVLLMIIFAMGAMKSHLRLRAVTTIIQGPAGARNWNRPIAHITVVAVASALYLYNTLAAAMSRRIPWRGNTYELKSPGETVIIRGTESDIL
jgi:hypothetical protein